MVVLAWFLAYWFRFNLDTQSKPFVTIPEPFYGQAVKFVPLIIVVYLVMFGIYGIPQSKWRYTSTHDLSLITKAAFWGIASVVVVMFLLTGLENIPPFVFPLHGVFLIVLLMATRILYRLFHDEGRNISLNMLLAGLIGGFVVYVLVALILFYLTPTRSAPTSTVIIVESLPWISWVLMVILCLFSKNARRAWRAQFIISGWLCLALVILSIFLIGQPTEALGLHFGIQPSNEFPVGVGLVFTLFLGILGMIIFLPWAYSLRSKKKEVTCHTEK